ncbi:hypothetical protein [Ferrimonas sp. YFM]|uniref:hypothetical protein n=1 Tax=Ferrimonas sp. YFM TaxID=3028878 RepID=UPI002573FCE4|nr:hypothetical protein [Ferrimonas sp. YFM]BDY05600.1 hypothetical protein F0521_26410 [Ferrimonas sp. YFM]
MEKKVTIILSVFGLSVLGIILGAKTPYVPFELLESIVIPYTSIFILFTLIISFSVFRGTDKKPAGFRYLALSYKEGKYRQFILSLFALPLISLIAGFYVYMLIATLPAYPTKMLSGLYQVNNATCLRTGRDKTRGSWSLFHLNNGEEWKVAGFGHICPNEKKYCDIYYIEGIAGYYIHNIKCN